MNIDSNYWQGEEPKNTEELNLQIESAVQAISQWVDVADSLRSEESVMIEAQIYWLEQLLKLSRINLKEM